MYLSSSVQLPTEPQALRQFCLQVLAHQAVHLSEFESDLIAMQYEWIRQPEIGMVMVKGRTEGQGAPFALGETTVSRCVLRLQTGQTGFGYVLGRNKQQATWIALADAHLQTERQDYWLAHLIEPLAQQWRAQQQQQIQKVAASKVDFFTMVRGED